MPRKLNPGTITTGHGKAAPDEIIQRPSLTGAGLVGAGPNIGTTTTPPTAEMADALSIDSHLDDPKAAHMASAIEHDGAPDVLISGNVEGALDELIGTVMERPPFVGEWARHSAFTGIPDWGTLKLRDQSLDNFNLLTNLADGYTAGTVFPYYFTSPGPAQDAEFTQKGGDPRTDHLWNDGLQGDSEPGMGWGTAHNGAFTRDGDQAGTGKEVFKTHMLITRPTGTDPQTGRPARLPVTISGSLFPADRGVIALFHLPPGEDGVTMKDAFLAQPLISDETDPLGEQGRVVAALLLGSGILDEQCLQEAGNCDNASICDGGPGGIFALGTSDGKYNPFAFPGRAAGQYDLQEIHTGVDGLNGNPLVAPYDDYDDDGNPGAARAASATVPAPGQVRLGTDPDAGVDVVSNGIPVLGATSSMYAVAPTAQNGSLGNPIHGDALVRDSNFFRYRLPVLKDYSPETGLKWTPRGEDATATLETHRFFEAAAPIASTYPDGTATSGTLRSAGFYESSFDEDYWVWQVARYRQSFLLPSTALDGAREEIGTYWLVHFKTEADFEKFAREGIFPWDASEGYEVYGTSLVSTSHVEEDGNIANEWAAATPPQAPRGPAPAYGYAADPYHQLRSTLMLDPDGVSVPAATTNAWDWSTTSTPGDEEVMWASGVAYFVPRNPANGNSAFTLDGIDLALGAGFWTSYRTDDDDLSGAGNTAPAVIASMNPMHVAHAAFAYGANPGGEDSSLDLVVGAAGAAHVPTTDYQRRHRFELPYTFLGSNGGGVFGPANGPLDADTLVYDTTGLAAMTLQGDDTEPAFSADAKIRAYFRRPLQHEAENTAVLPYSSANGHGLLLDPNPSFTMLFHSTRFDKANKVGIYGNFVVAAHGGALPNTTYSELYVAAKDTRESFLDETYRWRPAFLGYDSPAGYDATTIAHLVGPGMGGWVGGPIETPVRVGLCSGAPFNTQSWLLMEEFLVDMSANADLQVAGLPDRNPPVSAAAHAPFPSAGILLYPQKDYSTGYAPQTGTHITDNQPDYTGLTGVRQYVRVFDVAFSNHAGGGSTPPVEAAGSSEVTIRLDGVHMEDILYLAPGPGGSADDRIAVMVKVPGLTTWMDAGRAHGSGPGKQDPVLDGAGCLILGDRTYSFTDPETGYKGCYLTLDVGPVASFFENVAALSAYTSGSPAGEVPLLVKVLMADGAVNYNLENKYSGGSFGAVEPGADPREVRGLIGIEVVHPDTTLISPDATGQVMSLP